MSCKKTIIYLDGNGTTFQCKPSIDETTRWMRECSNPSTNNKLSLPSKKLIEDGKKYILKHCNVDESKYSVSFTSCGSESNIFIIKSITSSYRFKTKKIPHIITSSIEHSSILDCIHTLVSMKEIEVSYINPELNGIINHTKLEKYIKHNTALITIMGANNEIGSINNTKEIGKICKKHNIPFHSDYVQLFGKYKLDLSDRLITSLSVSFHKLYGPLGIGLLIVDKSIIDKYNLCGINTSMDPLRGVKIGTPAVPLIGGAIAAMKYNFSKRNAKDKHLLHMRNLLLSKLANVLPIIYYSDYVSKKIVLPNISIILFGPYMNEKDKYMHNTLLLSVVTKNIEFCNIKFKKYLERNNIIISIGSACHTHSKSASHVIKSLNVPPIIRRGVLRISLTDDNTINEVNQFIDIFFSGINRQLNIKK